MNILVLNSGSSSQKICLYQIEDALANDPRTPAWEGKVAWEGGRAIMVVRNAAGGSVKQEIKVKSHADATKRLLDNLCAGKAQVADKQPALDVVGHRIVNGGENLRQPTFITPRVKATIRRMAAFAPLHNRLELEGIDIVQKRFGRVRQVAVFDTGFHSNLPQAAAIYPGPYAWAEQGIRRFGFHGINHEYCAGRAAQMLGKELASLKLVTCHLGNGCSLAAIDGGQSVDTTMGFTPLDGLMMGTRSGSVDPGILTYLMQKKRFRGPQLDEILNRRSGLLGISGLSADMREIVSAMKDGHERAKLAFEIFVHRLRAGIGSMIAELKGIDALVFTAGIGENSPEVRAAACANFGFLGMQLDPSKNVLPLSDREISSAGSAVRVLVIRAQEDWAIARACWKLASERSA
jgi:acetate kinase